MDQRQDEDPHGSNVGERNDLSSTLRMASNAIRHNFGTTTNALPADDTTASADAQPSLVHASPKQTPPAKARRQESPETRSALLPWPPNPISLRPPLPQTSSAATASADANGSLSQPRDALPPSKSTVEVREYHVEEDSSGSSSDHEIVQEVRHRTKRAGNVINRVHLHKQKRTKSAPIKSLRTKTSTSSNALASASADPQYREIFRGDVAAYSRFTAEQGGTQSDPSQWDQQVADLISQVRVLQLEKGQLQEVIQNREQGFHQAAQQFRQQAVNVADQYQASAAQENAVAVARAAAAEQRADRIGDGLVQVREQARIQKLQHEEERKEQEIRTQQLAHEANAHVQNIAQQAQERVQQIGQEHQSIVQRVRQEVESEMEARITAMVQNANQLQADVAAERQKNALLTAQVAEEESWCERIIQERDQCYEEAKEAQKA